MDKSLFFTGVGLFCLEFLGLFGWGILQSGYAIQISIALVIGGINILALVLMIVGLSR